MQFLVFLLAALIIPMAAISNNITVINKAASSAEKVSRPDSKAKAVPTKDPKVSVAQKKNQDAQKIENERIDKLSSLIQDHYNKTKSATFNFEQSYKHPFLPTNESSKGEVSFKAQKMLWSYLEPATRKKKFYIAGKKFTYYLVNDALAYTHDCFDQDTLSASITFLWGQGKIKESFLMSAFTGKVPDESLSWLTLTPKEKNAPIKSIALGVDNKGVVKESMVVDQNNGINHFKFSNLVLNKPIDDKIFTFVAPKGVRVQAMPNVTCPEKTAPKALTTPTPSTPKKAPVAPKAQVKKK